MSLTSAALVTLADVKTFLGISGLSENDGNLEMVIEGVSAAFTNYADADFKSATYTSAKLDGYGRTYLYLPHFPVTTFTSLYEDETLLVKDTDYYVDTDWGILYRLPSGWPSDLPALCWGQGRQLYTATYVAGYATVPLDVKLACLVEVARQYEVIDKRMWGETSRTVEGVSVSLNTDELLGSTKATLDRYMRLEI